MVRRLFALQSVRPVATAVAALAVVLAACNATPPAAPALTDPKEILTKAVVSIKDVGAFVERVRAEFPDGEVPVGMGVVPGPVPGALP